MTDTYTIDEWRDAFMAESGMHGGRDMTESAFDDVVKRLRAPKPKFADGEVYAFWRTGPDLKQSLVYRTGSTHGAIQPRKLNQTEVGPDWVKRKAVIKLREAMMKIATEPSNWENFATAAIQGFDAEVSDE